MKNNSCVHEKEIMGALREGFVPEHCSRHLSECDHCRESVDILTLFKEESIRVAEEAEPPSADFLWWKSRLQKRHRLAKRATRCIAIMEFITPLMLICFLMPVAFYLNYSFDHILLQGVGWAVIILAALVTLASMAFYWHSAKKRIHHHSSAYPDR